MAPAFRLDWDACSRTRWQQLLGRAATSSYRQDWPYGEAVAARGHRVRRALLRREGEVLALAQFVERRLPGGFRFVLLTHGPLLLGGEGEDAAAEVEAAILREARRTLGRGFLLWTPDVAAGGDRRAGFRRVMSGQSTVRLDLRRSLAAIEAGLHGKWRNMLRRAREGDFEVKLVRGGPLLAWLIAAVETHRRKVGYRGPAPAFFHALAEASRPSRSQFALVARKGSTPLAGALFQLHGRGATYLAGYTDVEGRRRRAQHLLLWRAIEILREEGIATLDLGGVDTVGAPGVARFKLGLGGRVTTLAGSYLVPLPRPATRRSEGVGALARKERAA